jgi:hypothetical protein
MTTPSTPAGWYPDPDGSGGQRYWDGFTWTEHRSPAVTAPAASSAAMDEPADEFPASEQATSVVSLPDQPTSVVPTQSTPPATPEPAETGGGAHRAPDPEPTPTYEAPPATAPYGFSGPPAPPQPPFAADGSDGSGGGPDNRKLLIGFLSAVGGLLLVLVLVLVYAFVIRDDPTTQIGASGTSTSSSTSSSKTTSSKSSATETPSETATDSPTPTIGGQATEGDFVFSVASTDTGGTVTSPINEYIEKTANGEYFVVHLNVGNNGTRPLTFLSTLQKLNPGSDAFVPDDEASFYLGGGVVTINPGEQVETAVAFDVPVGTIPTSILVHGDPDGSGVELPVS